MSRDRSIAVSVRQEGAGEGEAPFRVLGKVAKAHTRIIWGVALTPDARAFATGGRDGKVKLWSLTAEGAQGRVVLNWM